MLARRTHASALAIVFSKSLESRRHRLSQASVRSITQRLGSALNVQTLCDRVTISMTHLPNSAIAAGSCLLTAVNTVSENVTQLWKQHPDIFQQRYRAVNILNVGRVHLHRKQRAIRISDDVTFSPLHLLARIKPAWTATFRGLHALAVDNTSRGTALASCRPARALDQDTIYVPPHVAITPIVKVMLDRGERRKVFSQSTPLAAGRKHIENAIQDDAKGPGWRAAKVTPFRQKSTQ